jgi:hypothetical protein
MNADCLIKGTALWLSTAAVAIAAGPDVWNIRTSPSSNHLNGVAYGNGLFVAVGNQATILTSSNGRDWTVRPAGTTAPTIRAAAYGQGRYVVGGGEGALIRSSTDGIHWTNGLSTIGAENINALAYGNGFFVAVGRGEQVNTSYILTSSNGLDWISRNVPTTNTLFGVSPDFGPDGVGWAEDLLVAVGDRGTIIASTNGVNWVMQNSGTTVPLRAVLFHRGMFALGDNGLVLASSDGASWSSAAPTSFHVRGAASSWDVMVAVGNYLTEGRIHVSTDGLTWPGPAKVFPQPLNAIAYGAGTFVAVGDGGLIIQSSATNEWTKTESGIWQELDYWSLDHLPAINQDLVAFRNPGSKALAINSSTTAYYSNSLAINSLVVDAFEGSLNLLLLNYAGLDVPLSVASDFIVGTNGSLLSYYSALRGGNLYLSGRATFSESSVVNFSKIELESSGAAELYLTNSSLTSDLLILGPSATAAQSGGSNQVNSLRMYGDSAYTLNNGTLNANSFEFQSLGAPGQGQFTLKSGSMDVQGQFEIGHAVLTGPVGRGDFLMQGGAFHAPALNLVNGTFTQTGGTNMTPTIDLPSSTFGYADYFLSNGTLVSSNVRLGYYVTPFTSGGLGNFSQSGGVHTNSTMTLYGYLRTQTVHPSGEYFLSGGRLVCDVLTLYGGVFDQSGGANFSRELVLDQAGRFNLSAGELVTSNTTVMTSGCVEGRFLQNGGSHTIQNRLLIEDWAYYTLATGTLAAANIETGPGALLNLQGGQISNPGLFTIRGGSVNIAGQTRELGQLQVIGVSEPACSQSFPGPRSLSLDWGPQSNRAPVVVRFTDSRDVPWSGLPLLIYGWRPPSDGFAGDHIYVGTDAESLTASQLNQLTFIYPGGQGSSPARLLANGELVPTLYVPNVGWSGTSGEFILFWDSNWELVTATNLLGPYIPLVGASSPFTNTFTDPQRYFRLRVPLP